MTPTSSENAGSEQGECIMRVVEESDFNNLRLVLMDDVRLVYQ